MSIRLEAVEKSFGKHTVLRGITCEFPNNCISTVLGISGSGKTTLLRIIAGLESPDKGDVYIDGQNVTQLPPQERNLGFVFQDCGVYEHLSVEDNFLLPLVAKGLSREAAKSHLTPFAEHFGLTSFLGRPAGTLSGGESQRLAIGKALVRGPRVMLLDEPFSHLDAPLQRFARRFVFTELRERNTTSVHVTHNHLDAQEAGGPIVFIENGCVVQEGDWETLYRKPATPGVANVVSFREPAVFTGRMRSKGEAKLFVSGSLGIPVPLNVDSEVSVVDGQAMQLFFRPEDICLSSIPTEHSVRSQVVAILRYGDERFARQRLRDGTIFEAKLGEADDPILGSEAFISLQNVSPVLLWPI